MNDLVGSLQSSFIEGRQILDGALVAGELIDSCKRRKSKAVILKLDFHKLLIVYLGVFWTGLLGKWGSPLDGVIGFALV